MFGFFLTYSQSVRAKKRKKKKNNYNTSLQNESTKTEQAKQFARTASPLVTTLDLVLRAAVLFAHGEDRHVLVLRRCDRHGFIRVKGNTVELDVFVLHSDIQLC